MSNEGSPAMRHPAFRAFIPIALSVLACGGGSAPRELLKPGVEIATRTPVKRVFYEDGGLNLVHAMAPAGPNFVIVGNSRICRLSRDGKARGCYGVPVDLWESEIVTNATGGPVAVFGAGGWGRPSAAVIDLAGVLQWKYDGGYAAMRTPAVVDRNGERVVLVDHGRRGVRALDFKTGEAGPFEQSPGRILTSADFDGDGARELLSVPGIGWLLITNGDGSEVASLHPDEPWHNPLVTASRPAFLVVSFDRHIGIYDGRLRLQKELSSAGSGFPLYVGAATFLGSGPGDPFVAVYRGRGGWHRSILCVYAADGSTIYREILDGDYPSLLPYNLPGGGMAFLLGGRGKVFLYSFERGG